MIKTIVFSVLAVAGAIVAYFGYDAKSQLNELVVKTEEVFEQNDTISANIETKEEDVKAATEERTAALDAKAETEANLEKETSLESSVKKDLARVQVEIDEYDSEIATIDAAVMEAEALISTIIPDAGNLSIDEVASYIEQLENDRKDREELVEEQELVASRLTKAVESAEEQKSRLQERLGRVREKIAKNAVIATVLSVDNSWGFVVVNKGSENSNITEQSELLVSRGGSYVGKLKVTSLEPRQTVCDIVAGSLRTGQRIRSGDRVSLSQTAAN